MYYLDIIFIKIKLKLSGKNYVGANENFKNIFLVLIAQLTKLKAANSICLLFELFLIVLQSFVPFL